MPSFSSLFGFFLSWWGLLLLSALDSSVFFLAPFGTDTLVVYMAARNRGLFWVYPLLSTAGSTAGAAVTFWIGSKAGEAGSDRLVSRRRYEQLKRRIQNKGVALAALPAILPPPFPLTAFILTAGALKVHPTRFFSIFAAARMIRFGAEGVLARRYGTSVLNVMQSPTFLWVVGGFVLLAIVGTAVSLIAVWRHTRPAKAFCD